MPPVNTQKQQQELFDEFIVVKKARGRFFGALNKFNKPLFPQHRLNLSVPYEVLAVVLMGLLVLGAIVFALGVERGRGLAGTDVSAATAELAPVPEPVVAAPVEPVTVQVAEAPKPVALPTAKPYTIQVASYKARDMADKELSRLKGQGYNAEAVKKGSYYILCVGSFESKDAAKQTFAAMQKKYKGCIIRKR
ncbi:MAG: SPOR domain-containing protein [Candidatus Omnitrophota bacterium]